MTQEQYLSLFIMLLPFIVLIIAFLGQPVAYWVIGKLPASKQERARQAVQTAVHATEQLAIAAADKIPSDQKKAMAFNMAKILLKSAGISLDDSIINTFIEAAVFALNQAGAASANATSVITPIATTNVKQ